jgi:hypothetical protein
MRYEAAAKISGDFAIDAQQDPVCVSGGAKRLKSRPHLGNHEQQGTNLLRDTGRRSAPMVLADELLVEPSGMLEDAWRLA